MLKTPTKNREKLIILLALIVIATLSFQLNFFRAAESSHFESFDKGSQSLVLGSIVADKLSLEKHGSHIGFLSIGESFDYMKNMLDAYPIFSGEVPDKDVFYSPYKSQYGIQGPVFSKAYSLFSLKTIEQLQLLNSTFFALVIALITLLYIKIYNLRFATIFFIVMISSPWIVVFARNLYWVPALWFLPAVFALLAYQAKTRMSQAIFITLVGAAVFLKSLAGYEYLSAITLFACSVFVIAPIFNSSTRKKRENLTLFSLTFAACVLGFICALLLHAGMRGDTILSGLLNIFEQDVKRRTYGDPTTFDEVFKASLQSSPLDVLKIYTNEWNTYLFAYLPGATFKIMIIFSALGFLYTTLTKKSLDKNNALIFTFFFITSSSWYLLAKGHSYIHTQLNYVLWYFGFAQALLYTCTTYIAVLLKDFRSTLKERSLKKSNAIIVFIFGFCALTFYSTDSKRENEFKDEIARLSTSDGPTITTPSNLTVKLTRNGELVLYSENCRQVDLKKTFYLHVYKTDPQTPEDNYQNLDFEWKQFELRPPRWPSRYANSCIAKVPLPNESITKLDFGQYSITNGSIDISWRDSLSLEKQVSKITATDLSDANWKNGVSLHGFFVSNNFRNRQALKVGGYLKFSASGLRRISALEYTDSYINITVDGAPLNPVLDGYPNEILLQP
ncbi:glucosyltransferase domain-containing protein [Pseudomonas sp. NMI795_08]|uniref:glucosyltransferase domain-containing protein n=1 Tax=Pseudomonas sp. NMI795_08 TaxID=2903144 RepID=UPI001E54E18E|nr:glucosyltransferase domain-containing protein [Pseudomonas sp. NMI795_08]MCE1115120.1 glucosyltransferase domain-containing protein [Pseudomonas sp. NMI795_08]